jgi:flagellar hook-associated protein FlgK
MRFYQLWHERVHQAPEHKWLRDQVSAAAKALVQRSKRAYNGLRHTAYIAACMIG